MIFRNNRWKELLIISDRERLFEITTILKNNDIAYRTKTQDLGHGNRRGGLINSIGENQQFLYIYQVFVHRSDYDSAKKLCRLI